jgi:galactosylxylosylprotein 3-beta-galactosyltransferase
MSAEAEAPLAAAESGPSTVVVFISSARQNFAHRRAIRRTWMRYATDDVLLSPAERARILRIEFVVSRAPADEDDPATAAATANDVDARLDLESAEHGDIFFARRAPEGYNHLWAKALEYLEARLELLPRARQQQQPTPPPPPSRPDFFFHADDDSYVRLDLLLREVLAAAPRRRFYWGYVWNSGEEEVGQSGGGAADGATTTRATTTTTTTTTRSRTTAPIRDPRSKSYMPPEHYPLDTYPPFCSGCGFALSRDLAEALVLGAGRGDGAVVQREYRLLDPPFGIHLCGPCPPQGRGAVGGGGPVVPVHCGRVRPYRALPLFCARTIVQHYMRPEEMPVFFGRALAAVAGSGEEQEVEERDEAAAAAEGGGNDDDPAASLFEQLVGMGLLRR